MTSHEELRSVTQVNRLQRPQEVGDLLNEQGNEQWSDTLESLDSEDKLL
jgi:hypothetical protein